MRFASRSLVAFVTALIVLVFTAPVPAAAWTHIGDVAGTQSWTPRIGQRWGQVYYTGGGQYREWDAEGFAYYYGTRVSEFGGNWPYLVVHAFVQNSSPAVDADMDAYGPMWTNYPNPDFIRKTAGSGTYKNEWRVGGQPSLMANCGSYYAGATYWDVGYDWGGPAAAEATYDGYGCTLCKQYMGKWYLDANDTLRNGGQVYASPSPFVVANPNPVSAGTGQGTTQISWDSYRGGGSQVYVSPNGGGDILFAQNCNGVQQADWIGTGNSYLFRLYEQTGHSTVLANTIVTRSVSGSISASPNRCRPVADTGAR